MKLPAILFATILTCVLFFTLSFAVEAGCAWKCRCDTGEADCGARLSDCVGNPDGEEYYCCSGGCPVPTNTPVPTKKPASSSSVSSDAYCCGNGHCCDDAIYSGTSCQKGFVVNAADCYMNTACTNAGQAGYTWVKDKAAGVLCSGSYCGYSSGCLVGSSSSAGPCNMTNDTCREVTLPLDCGYVGTNLCPCGYGRVAKIECTDRSTDGTYVHCADTCVASCAGNCGSSSSGGGGSTSSTTSSPPTSSVPTSSTPTSSTGSCWGYNEMESPSTANNLIAGNSYYFSGWARICEGPAGQGVSQSLDLHLCGNKDWTCSPMASATRSNRADKAAVCNAGDPNSAGWSRFYVIPTSTVPGPHTIRAVEINDPAADCVVWTDEDYTTFNVIQPTPYHLGCSAGQCSRIAGAGAGNCQYPIAGSYTEGDVCDGAFFDPWATCSAACGPGGTQSRDCVCSGACCVNCSDSDGTASCGATQSRACCSDQAPQNTPSVTSVVPGTCSSPPTATVNWSFSSGASGCGAPWGYSCTVQTNTFTVVLRDSTGNFISTTGISSSDRSRVVNFPDWGSYDVAVCAENGGTARSCSAWTPLTMTAPICQSTAETQASEVAPAPANCYGDVPLLSASRGSCTDQLQFYVYSGGTEQCLSGWDFVNNPSNYSCNVGTSGSYGWDVRGGSTTLPATCVSPALPLAG